MRFADLDWTLRELQPAKNKLSLLAWNGRLNRLERVLQTMGAVVAWTQLRSSGRKGAATADALVDFATQSCWRPLLVDYAQVYAITVNDDWKRFCESR